MREVLKLVLACGVGLVAGHQLAAPESLPQVQPATNWANREYVSAIPPVACPEKPTVVFIAGQSNAANYVGRRFEKQPNVYVWHRGKCYESGGPMPGADGNRGSFWPLVGAQMQGSVLFVNASIGGTTVEQWTGDLGDYLSRRLQEAPKPDYFLWQQGEADTATPAEKYKASLQAVIASVRKVAPDATVLVARASLCKDRSAPHITKVQAEIAPGPDLDSLNSEADRYDGCHFSGQGGIEAARLWAEVLAASRPGGEGRQHKSH